MQIRTSTVARGSVLPMKIVVLNAGSGSQRCSLFELPIGPLSDEPHDPIWEAKLDSTAPDQPEGKLVIRISRHGEDIEAGCMDEEATTAQRDCEPSEGG